MSTPVLSVVVPIYNVAPYLPSCLDSVAAQARTCAMDVVLVDDGSTDASSTIAAEYAERHPFMRLISKKNGGLGQARNVGARHATGDYLTFVDSDDILPEGTYSALVKALEDPALDFASGNVVRLRGKSTSASIAHQKSHSIDYPSTHISAHPALMWDTVAWNKVFRRRFWEDHELAFPEGVLYEDLEIMTRCYLLAKQVAVLKRVSYLWRIRTEWPPSITQRRGEIRNLNDRFAAIFAVFDTIERYGTRELRKAYEWKILSNDIPLYVRQYDRADRPEYRALVEEYSRKALRLCSPDSLAGLKSADRVRYWLIDHNRASELPGVNDCERFHFDRCELSLEDRRVVRAYPTLDADRPPPPADVRDVTRELSPHTCVYDLRQDGRALRMDVHAFVPGISPAASHALTRRFYLKNLESAHRIELEAVPLPTPVPTPMLQVLHFDGTWSRVRLSVPAELLLAHLAENDRAATWEVWVDCELNGFRWSDCVRRQDVTYTDHTRYVDGSGCRVSAYLGRDQRLSVRAERLGPRLTGDSRPGTFGISVPEGGPDSAPTLVLHGEHGPFAERRLDERTSDGIWLVDRSLLTAMISECGFGNRRLAIRAGSAEQRIMAAPGERAVWSDGDGVVGIAGDGEGYLRAFRWRGGCRVAALALTETGVLRVRLDEVLTAQPWSGCRVELDQRSSGRRLSMRSVMVDGDLSYEADLARVERWSMTTPISLGDWRLVVREHTWSEDEYEPRVAWHLREALPTRCAQRGISVDLRVNDWDLIALRVDIDRPPDANIKAKRRSLEEDFYPAARRRPTRPAVLFASWNGQCFADGPRRIYEELSTRACGLEMLWAVADPTVWTPEGVRRVQRGTADWFEAFGRARYIVTNQTLPDHFTKREGCTFVRLVRGIPFKKIGLDASGMASLDPARIQRLVADAAQWDILVAGHPDAARLYRRAFAYNGRILDSGQPRLDPLRQGESARVRQRMRDVLGIEPSDRLLLYAPTWRDNVLSRPGKYVMPPTLDMSRLLDELGSGWRLVLKNHSYVGDRTGGRLDGRVINASAYPEMTDLYLAADVLLTDYSSAAFDFAVTGKPIFIVAPDADEYRERVRGVYWDLESELPGPIVQSTAALIEQLQDLDGVADAWRARYHTFQQRFCDTEDGRSAARTVDAIFADWLE